MLLLRGVQQEVGSSVPLTDLIARHLGIKASEILERLVLRKSVNVIEKRSVRFAYNVALRLSSEAHERAIVKRWRHFHALQKLHQGGARRPERTIGPAAAAAEATNGLNWSSVAADLATPSPPPFSPRRRNKVESSSPDAITVHEVDLYEASEPFSPFISPPLPAAIAARSLRPLIIGSGPAGLFCAYVLAKNGLRPVVIDQGSECSKRRKDVFAFWHGNRLNCWSNAAFGEGGAGTFSDGKLTSRNRSDVTDFVLRTYVELGCAESCLYESKAHVGTDVLYNVVPEFRKRLQQLGVTFLFDTQVTQLHIQPSAPTFRPSHSGGHSQPAPSYLPAAFSPLRDAGVIAAAPDHEVSQCSDSSRSPRHFTGVRVRWRRDGSDGGRRDGDGLTSEAVYGECDIVSDLCVVACGHSSHSTYRTLHEGGVKMTPKDWTMGLRLQMPQSTLNRVVYGKHADVPEIGAAVWRYARAHPADGRGVYSFCMCPGGTIVNSSHGDGCVAVNGMSYSTRSSSYANSAVVVQTKTHDVARYWGKSEDECSGMDALAYQQHWERAAFHAGGSDYSIPAQRLGDYLSGNPSKGLPKGLVFGQCTPTDLNGCLPDFITTALHHALRGLLRSHSRDGLFADDTLLTGIESRTSAPLRVLRHGTSFESCNTQGLFPCGEGAGYSGGIVSSAVDGVNTAMALLKTLVQRRALDG
ncbi:unnamed protein product [Vitrella brassicaformis CCMP3155]|uniref:FAD-dependent protein C-terminal domain-containing protein n=3 Tax=Vitrella brassicaformis TaxID=1169539 RepID=A0A0G4FVS1_VITBC|nr:unnamed protein product [Vitrella brassicaformis CCMP3155]|eukprot:CEM18688.1 unnamed protein product [Vitrella brassicaformis CCMP3155]